MQDVPEGINWDVTIPGSKTSISLRIDNAVLQWYKQEQPKGYQTLMHAVLRKYMENMIELQG
jgi:uncharacterized protein (DUF4415 family)